MERAAIIGADAAYAAGTDLLSVGSQNRVSEMLEAAISDVESKGILPKEGWWGLQRVLYYEKE